MLPCSQGEGERSRRPSLKKKGGTEFCGERNLISPDEAPYVIRWRAELDDPRAGVKESAAAGFGRKVALALE